MHERIIADLYASYGITITHATPITGGYLHEKWKVSSDHGDLLVKQFSLERYPPHKLERVSRALAWHDTVQKQGVPCPVVLLCNQDPIRQLDADTAYMVMTFCPGSLETPTTVTPEQMRSLGEVCGQLHRALRTIPTDGAPFYPGYTLQKLRDHHDRCMNALSGDDPEGYAQAIMLQKPILGALTEDFYARQPKGLAHQDFAVDNILFEDNAVSAILDFDTCYHSYPRRDIGRALLSFALDGSCLIKERVRAFQTGYAQHESLTLSDLADAMKLVWCLEVSTWIQPTFFREKREKVIRFREEMIWLSEHWFDLEALMR